MRVFLIFIQIIMFPLTFLVISWLFTLWAKKRNSNYVKLGYACIFSISSYILGGFVLFPLFLAFKPIKIDGISYLLGTNLYVYWLISFIIVTPIVVGLCSYFFYFKKVSVSNYIKEGILIGILQLPLGWFFEIVIYVYWRKTIPSIYYYFFGKNFPWIEINWLIGVIVPIVLAYILSKRRIIKKQDMNT